MKQPTCCHCHQKFEYKNLLKLTLWPIKPIRCPHCDTVQYVSSGSRMKASLFNSLLVFFFLILVFTNISFVVLFSLYILFAIVFLLLTPYFYTFQEKDEPLW